MREIKIYFITGTEFGTAMSDEEIKDVKDQVTYDASRSIELNLGDKVMYIPISSIERIEISK